MSDRTHSLLSPSGSERWLICHPSVRLTENIPDQESDYAMEGTLAHAMWEILIKDKLGIWNALQVVRQLEQTQSHRLYNKQMSFYAHDFVDYVLGIYQHCLLEDINAKIFIEEEIDLSGYIPEGRGHVDIAIVYLNKIIIIDYKYGQGVPVKAKDNPQMKMYALGIFAKVLLDVDIEEIEMTVYQPRLDNIDTDIIFFPDFAVWVKEVLIPSAAAAWQGEGNLVPGHHCKFCKLKSRCRAWNDFNLELADLAFQEIHTLTDDEMREVIDKAKIFKDWISSVEEYALSEAVKGRKWRGLKLVEGRSNRKFKNEAKVIQLLTEKGFPESQIFDKTLRNLTELEAHFGKKYFKEILSSLVIKPQGKPTLVPESDKRPEFVLRTSAEEDFKDLYIDDELLSML